MKQKHERKFTIIEHLKALYFAAKSFPFLRFVRRHKLFNKRFKERIMLKVTEVNGCALCSYVHTKIALQSGMTQEEISNLLAGELDGVPDKEQVGVIFGMHYADSNESPDEVAIDRVIDEYGEETYDIILAVARMITFTNSMGIAFANMKDRLLLKQARVSRFFHDVFAIITSFVLFPIVLVLQWMFFLLTPHKKQILKES